MSDFKLTPKRLELLQAVSDMRVKSTRWSYLHEPSVSRNRGPGESGPRFQTVTAAFEKLRVAGLVRLAAEVRTLGSVACILTNAGRAALATDATDKP